MRRAKYCPYCGEEKQFGCRCDYGHLMKAKMEPNELQQDFFHKRYCPKCGSNSTHDQCRQCGFNFTNEDFWTIRLW